MQDITIQQGDYLIPDGWGSWGSCLRMGDEPVDASYHGSQYRIDSNTHQLSMPVNLSVSGRSLNWTKASWNKKPAVRVKIEWVHDGEPNTYSHGWVILHSF